MKHQRHLLRLGSLTMFLVAAAILPVTTTLAQPVAQARIEAPTANINITPRRVVFDGVKRTEAVYVFNQGTAPVTVDITLIDNVMLPTGEIAPLAEVPRKGSAAQVAAARLQSAREAILATPSRMTIEPGRSKAIRIRASIPESSGTTAEWRTHLTVSTVPPPDAGLTADAASSPQKGEMAFRIQSAFGVSIPLIVRGSAAAAAATLGPISFERGEVPNADGSLARSVPMLSFKLSRTGANSIYGNIEARIDGKAGREVIGFIRGIAVYPEIDQRRVVMQLNREPKPGETVIVTFHGDDPGLRGVTAEVRFTAQ